ncbi:uncharacterized protein LOC143424516 [Xylocopa sonorina]|uniref:uncharacterized protein LOC143424516 n=1 Tax=Xylocopa sonorina TaxID=1818115 RepID=UPI00403B018D
MALDTEREIRKTLLAISEVSLKIKNELNLLNNLLQQDGPLQTAVINVVAKLTAVAQRLKINVEDILSNNENENKLQSNFRSIVSSACLQEKLSKCLNNM